MEPQPDFDDWLDRRRVLRRRWSKQAALLAVASLGAVFVSGSVMDLWERPIDAARPAFYVFFGSILVASWSLGWACAGPRKGLFFPLALAILYAAVAGLGAWSKSVT